MPDATVLFIGDLFFHGGTPLTVSGAIPELIDTLERLKTFGGDVLVPGHGEPCGVEQVDFHLRYWEMIRTAADAMPAGLDPVQAAHELDQGDFGHLEAAVHPVREEHE